MKHRYQTQSGFTLIEVLLALVIIAISLTALLRATGQDVRYTYRLKEKSVEHWVAWQAINQIQSGLITLRKGRPQTFQTIILNTKWYWRAQMLPTEFKYVQKIKITVSSKQAGPFTESLIGYKYL